MKTKLKNPITFMRRWGIPLAILLIVVIATFSQWGGNPIGTAVDNRVKPVTTEIKDDPTANKDDQTAKNYVLNVEELVSRFEMAYQSARVSNMDTKTTYLTQMGGIYGTFARLKYSPDNPVVAEFKRLAGLYMQNRMNYIVKLISEHVYADDQFSLASLQEGNRTYTTLLAQMNKVKNVYSIQKNN